LEEIDFDNCRHDIMQESGVIVMEMDLNYQLYQRNSFGHHITQDETLTVYKNIAWLIGLIINAIVLVTY